MDDKTMNKTEKQELQPKQPYDKPQIIYRAPLEVMAADCTGAGGKALGEPTCTNGFS